MNFAIFEEDPKGKKHYDLMLDYTDDIEDAIKVAKYFNSRNGIKVYVAEEQAYNDGNYDYIYETGGEDY